MFPQFNFGKIIQLWFQGSTIKIINYEPNDLPKLDLVSSHLTKKIDKFIIGPAVHDTFFSASTSRRTVVICIS